MITFTRYYNTVPIGFTRIRSLHCLIKSHKSQSAEGLFPKTFTNRDF